MFKLTIALGLLAAIAAPLTALAAEKDQPTQEQTVERHKIADCNDGTEYWSTSDSHRGVCGFSHKGVKAWADGSPVKAKRAAHAGEYR